MFYLSIGRQYFLRDVLVLRFLFRGSRQFLKQFSYLFAHLDCNEDDNASNFLNFFLRFVSSNYSISTLNGSMSDNQ